MKKTLFFIVMAVFVLSLETKAQVLASTVLEKAAAKAKSAKGINAVFKISSSAKTINGQLLAAGSRFYVKAGTMESWYNGKDLYSYNLSTRETTVVKPTTAELSEINPLLYLNGYNNYLTASFSKNSGNGKYIVDLKPKGKKAQVKKVTVTINSKTFYPEMFSITSPDGSVSSVVLTNLIYNASLSNSTFEYPKKKYPSATVVDLR